MKVAVRHGVLGALLAVLSACGGGDGGSGGVPSGSGSTPPTTLTPGPGGSGSPTGDTSGAEQSANSYWLVGTYRYNSGGYSSSATNHTVNGSNTSVVISTATLAGGDTANGAYSGSALSAVFKGVAVDGIYTVAPDMASYTRADGLGGVIFIQVNVGVNTTTGSALYAAASGRVKVSKDSNGFFHLTSQGALPLVKTLDVMGGISGSPATTTLNIVDAF